MKTTQTVPILLLAAVLLALPARLLAHGSPSQWAAESTDYGCWILRWLLSPGSDAAETAAGIQVVFGRIVPPRTGQPQPGITSEELAGATTLNVRIFDPSLADARSARVILGEDASVDLEPRRVDGAPGDSPSYFLVGAAADRALEALRAGRLVAVSARRADGTEVRFANSDDGLRVAFAMYDACLQAKPSR